MSTWTTIAEATPTVDCDSLDPGYWLFTLVPNFVSAPISDSQISCRLPLVQSTPPSHCLPMHTGMGEKLEILFFFKLFQKLHYRSTSTFLRWLIYILAPGWNALYSAVLLELSTWWQMVAMNVAMLLVIQLLP